MRAERVARGRAADGAAMRGLAPLLYWFNFKYCRMG